jgi:hypothetical protein
MAGTPIAGDDSGPRFAVRIDRNIDRPPEGGALGFTASDAPSFIRVILPGDPVMAATHPVETKKFFSVDEANRALPLVRRIVADIVRQWQVVSDMRDRLSALAPTERRRRTDDLYGEELAQTQAEMDSEEEQLRTYIEELERLGVELKGRDGLCDFPSLKDGREVYLCWRLGEPEIQHWHEVDAGFAGRQPLSTLIGPRTSKQVR